MIEEKRCPDCGKVKPRAGFHRNRRAPDGMGYYCKPCHRRRVDETKRSRKRREAAKLAAEHNLKPGEVFKRGEILRGCRKCGEARLLAMFPTDPRSHRGLMWTCSPCRRKHRAPGRDAKPSNVDELAAFRSRVEAEDARTAAAWERLAANTAAALGR